MNKSNFQALLEIILPPGSTSTDLQSAVNSAEPGSIVIISGDMPFTGSVTIPEDKDITIQSDEGNNWIMSNPGATIRHFEISGSVILQNVTLDGEDNGGGVYIDGGNVTINEGATIQNCYSENSHGGGAIWGVNECNITINGGIITHNSSSSNRSGSIYLLLSNLTMTGGLISENQESGVYSELSIFRMTGGKISGNTGDEGGGLIFYSSDFIMDDGEISGNWATSGGGVFLTYGSSFTMNGGKIINNTAVWNGGGIYLYDKEFIMTGGSISGNVVTEGSGGGITSNTSGGNLEIIGECYITNNSAPKGNGGGITTQYPEHNSLFTGKDVVFSCNNASVSYSPPPNAGTLYPQIQFASSSISNHPLNNFDIEYTNGEPIAVRFHVTYNANGGTGSYVGPEIGVGETDTVLSPEETGISRPDYTFTEWNTERDGSGLSYSSGSAIILSCSAVLFAQWNFEPAEITVTYSSNGGTGGYVGTRTQFSDYVIMSANQAGVSRSGFIFTNWNTQPDGSGETFAPGDIIAIAESMDFYAQWRAIPELKKLCRASSATRCRTSIDGQKIWVDNENAGDTRPPSVEIILLRNGEVYKRKNIDSSSDGYFSFCCLPKWQNSGNKYNYQIDEVVPDRYTKTVEGYTIINTFNP